MMESISQKNPTESPDSSLPSALVRAMRIDLWPPGPAEMDEKNLLIDSQPRKKFLDFFLCFLIFQVPNIVI